MEKMAKPHGLVLRGRYYYYRTRIPKDLVERYGRLEFSISLNTDDYKTALGRLHEEAAKLQAEFTTIRSRRTLFTSNIPKDVSAQTLKISEQEAIRVARALVAQRLAIGDETSMNQKQTPTEEEVLDVKMELNGDFGRLLDIDNEEGNQSVQLSAINALKQAGYDIKSTKDIDNRVLYIIRRALIAITRIEFARMSNDRRDEPKDALFVDIGSNDTFEKIKNKHSSETVASAMKKFWDRVILLKPKAPKTLEKYAAYSEVVVRFFGPDTPMSDITRDKCHDFRDIIARLPPNYTKTKDAPPPDAPLEDVAAYADRKNLERIAYATQELYLARMTSFLDWSRKERITPDLDVSDIKPRGQRPEKHTLRSSFTEEQLTAIFTAPIFSGCKDDGRGYNTPGVHVIKKSRYWLPLIGLCTGMREGEILSLRASQIRKTKSGIDFIDLTKRTGKNKYSKREIPIHSLIINAGFIDFVESKRNLKNDFLFDDVPVGADNTQTSIFSKRFGTFLKGCGVKGVDSETCFHMFRHTLTDALSRGQVPENIIEEIQGWSRDMKMARSYGDGKDADTLKPWIEKIDLPHFDMKYLTR